MASERLYLGLNDQNLRLRFSRDHFALRSEVAYYGRGRGGGGGGGDERVKARPRIPPEKDRRDRGPPPEQWKC